MNRRSLLLAPSLLLTAFAFAASPTRVLAQAATPAPAAAATNGMWKAVLPGGTYEIALRSIIAVSSHEYVVDGSARVTEVNIDTAGTLLVRFYYLEPNTPNQAPGNVGAATLEKAQSLLAEATSRVDPDGAWQKVSKSYPATTHAHTVEYRLSSKDQLKALFTSVETAWRLNKGAAYQVSGSSASE